MINKPINLSPYNNCVTTDTDVHIKYDIPNAKINGCVTLVNELDSGNCVLVRRDNFEEATNQIDLNIGQSFFQTILKDGQEVTFENGGTYNISFDDTIWMKPGDTFVVTIVDGDKTITHETDPLYIQDNALTFYDGMYYVDISTGYWQILNDSMPNGLTVSFSKFTGNITIAASVKHNSTEYSWNSFYWQTPTKTGNEEMVALYKNNKLSLRADLGTPPYSVRPKYTHQITFGDDKGYTIDKRYTCVYTNGVYADGNFYRKRDYYDYCGHTEGEDTSSRCYKGQLTDYFGQPAIVTDWDLKVNEDGASKENELRKFIDEEFKNGRAPILEFIAGDGSLLSCGRILAYDILTDGIARDGGGQCLCIIDNPYMSDQLQDAVDANRLKIGFIYHTTNTLYTKSDGFYMITRINLYAGNTYDYETDFSGQLMLCNGDYYYIKSSKFTDYSHELNTIPPAPKLYTGDKVTLYDRTMVEVNTSPSCYFRYKTKPKALVHNASDSSIQNGTFNDVKGKFGVWFYYASINYFHLYLYVYNEANSSWELLERSPMLYNSDDTYEFAGLVHSQRYKVNATVIDTDGDEWNSQDMVFTINNPFVDTPEISAVFNSNNTSIDVSLSSFLRQYDVAAFEFYKIAQTDRDNTARLTYAGGGIAKVYGDVIYDQWSDYNICNDTYYDYYARMSYVMLDGDVGVKWLRIATGVHTDFKGTSMLGLKKAGGTKLSLVNSFNILYQFDNNMGELNNELSREYINSFGKYPKEVKGHQNYITGSLSGLLGSECNGIYEEPKGIRKDWNNFVDDDTIKLYRGLDGETMVISIDKNVIKPFYYSGVGIVNEISITFKEIASASQYAIFSTTTVGD